MRLVLDASVAIKFYALEPDTPEAMRWADRHNDFAVPDIFLVEVMQALLRLHRRERRLDLDVLHHAYVELGRATERPTPSSDLMPHALSLAIDLGHGLHDCLYLALAHRIGCPLLTADMTLARKVRAAVSPPAIVLLHTDPVP